jgi:hypothetical protein
VSTTGTTPLKTITQLNRERLLGVRIADVPDHVRGIEMVEDGSADAFLMDEVLLIGLIATRPHPAKLKVVGKYLTIEPLAIMLPKGRRRVQARGRRRDEAPDPQRRGAGAARQVVHPAHPPAGQEPEPADQLPAAGLLEVPERLGAELSGQLAFVAGGASES